MLRCAIGNRRTKTNKQKLFLSAAKIEAFNLAVFLVLFLLLMIYKKTLFFFSLLSFSFHVSVCLKNGSPHLTCVLFNKEKKNGQKTMPTLMIQLKGKHTRFVRSYIFIFHSSSVIFSTNIMCPPPYTHNILIFIDLIINNFICFEFRNKIHTVTKISTVYDCVCV